MKLCSDYVASPSAVNCTAYLSTCAFNGTSCTIPISCSSYALTTFAQCNATTDGVNACGWTTGGVTCKFKACTDAIPSPSAAKCAAYISTCAYNGIICAPEAVCTSYAFNTFALCNATSDGIGNACGWATGSASCKRKACTDAVPFPSAANCIAYLSTCSFNGINCFALNACTSFPLTSFLLCNATTDGSGSSCSWTTSGTSFKAKACTDPVPSPSSATCTAFMSTCAYNGSACAPAAACSSYALNNITACNSTNDGYGNSCGWSTGASNCKAKACSDPVASPSAASCTAYISNCAFNGTVCAHTAACTSYDLNTFALCNSTTDGAGNACGWSIARVECKAKECTDPVPMPSAATCTAYLSSCAFNGETCANAAACSTYALNTFHLCNETTDGAGNACGWSTARVTCKAKECTDSVPMPSAATCTAYLSYCAFNGETCANAAACTTYPLFRFPLCNSTTDGAGNACGWSIARVECKAKECTDPVPMPSAATCTAYLSSCAFNGETCANAAACSTYALNTFYLCNTTTDGAGNACGWTIANVTCKAKECTDPVPMPSAATCTAYLSTCAFNYTNCAVAAPCSSYNWNTFAFCNATTDGAGNVCGWVTGATSCKAKACTDTIPTPSANNCAAYLGSCGFNGSNCFSGLHCSSYAYNSFALC